MKSILLLAGLCALLAGCGRTETVSEETRAVEDVTVENTETVEVNEEIQSAGAENDSKVLIAYFTRAENIQIDPEVDAVASASINIDGSSYEGNLAIGAACQCRFIHFWKSMIFRARQLSRLLLTKEADWEMARRKLHRLVRMQIYWMDFP